MRKSAFIFWHLSFSRARRVLGQRWAQMDSVPEVPVEDGPIGKIRAFFENAAWQNHLIFLLSSWEGVFFICSQLRLLSQRTWVSTSLRNALSRPKWQRWGHRALQGVCGVVYFIPVLYISYLEVINDLVISRASPSPSRIPTTLIPTETESTFWLALDRFDYSADSKNGCQGLWKNACGVFQIV